ncbi:hypothetical protein CPB86DRAFT_590261 [Serendipita vermifera]|nr:hypothetical protein CPB86DRAFT_590261 [Serendipita vermifera]
MCPQRKVDSPSISALFDAITQSPHDLALKNRPPNLTRAHLSNSILSNSPFTMSTDLAKPHSLHLMSYVQLYLFAIKHRKQKGASKANLGRRSLTSLANTDRVVPVSPTHPMGGSPFGQTRAGAAGSVRAKGTRSAAPGPHSQRLRKAQPSRVTTTRPSSRTSKSQPATFRRVGQTSHHPRPHALHVTRPVTASSTFSSSSSLYSVASTSSIPEQPSELAILEDGVADDDELADVLSLSSLPPLQPPTFSSPNTTISPKLVDWTTADSLAKDDRVLKMNTDAMRDLSRDAAQALRREEGWIRNPEPFDNSSWVPKDLAAILAMVKSERGGQREGDSSVPASSSTYYPSSPTRPRKSLLRRFVSVFGKLKKRLRHPSSPPSPSSSAPQASGTRSLRRRSRSLLPLITPRNSLWPEDEAHKNGGDVMLRDDDNSERQSIRRCNSPLAEPIIVITDWDEQQEMKVVEGRTKGHLWDGLAGGSGHAAAPLDDPINGTTTNNSQIVPSGVNGSGAPSTRGQTRGRVRRRSSSSNVPKVLPSSPTPSLLGSQSRPPIARLLVPVPSTDFDME